MRVRGLEFREKLPQSSMDPHRSRFFIGKDRDLHRPWWGFHLDFGLRVQGLGLCGLGLRNFGFGEGSPNSIDF